MNFKILRVLLRRCLIFSQKSRPLLLRLKVGTYPIQYKYYRKVIISVKKITVRHILNDNLQHRIKSYHLFIFFMNKYCIFIFSNPPCCLTILCQGVELLRNLKNINPLEQPLLIKHNKCNVPYILLEWN